MVVFSLMTIVHACFKRLAHEALSFHEWGTLKEAITGQKRQSGWFEEVKQIYLLGRIF